MYPLLFTELGRRDQNPGRPAISLPGLDYSDYPEFETTAGLEGFKDLEQAFHIPLPLGFPYMDWVVADMNGLQQGNAVFPLPNSEERFFLENIILLWPKAGAGAYPEINPTGNESPSPTIQISSADPNGRAGKFAMSGPQMFARPMHVDLVGGRRGINIRRQFFFSARDRILVDIHKTNAVDPRWVGIGIIGRMINPDFIQGAIA